MTTPCTGEHELHWYPAVNEDGWRCCHCGFKPGEPPGFSPQHDRDLLDCKVWALVHDLVDARIVYVSNSSHGDSIVAAITAAMREAGTFDQYSIVAAIVGGMAESHAKYWGELSTAILAGKDPRDRCWCGALSTCTTFEEGGGRTYRCSDHWGVENPQLALELGEVKP